MHYGMRSDRFPRLHTYSEAVRKEDSIAAYKKGKVKGLKPLAERRRHWLTIRLADNADVVIKMYDTDIITYRPDNTIIIQQDGWATASTHETIGAILGCTLVRRDSKGWISTGDGKWYLLREHGDNVFKRDENGRFAGMVNVNPLYPKTLSVDRKALNKVTAQYKPFIKYAIAATKLRGTNGFNVTEYFDAFGETEKIPDFNEYQVLELTRNQDDWYKALLLIYRLTFFHAKDPVKEVREHIANLIKRVHRDTVFIAKEVTDGRIVVDRNIVYFR